MSRQCSSLRHAPSVKGQEASRDSSHPGRFAREGHAAKRGGTAPGDAHGAMASTKRPRRVSRQQNERQEGAGTKTTGSQCRAARARAQDHKGRPEKTAAQRRLHR
jgi:hypothetical protein